MSHLTRRAVLAGTAALGGAALAPRLARAASDIPALRARPSTAQLTPAGYPSTAVWSYATDASAGIPGPEIRIRAGQRVRYRLINELPQPTAVHWHGIRIENAMDGAAPLTQAPVPPGESFDYDFVAPDPGTYWYHSHDRSWEQVARGLAGPLIVEDREPWFGLPGAATGEMTLVLDDWLLNQDASIIEGEWDSLNTAAHGGRLGNTVTVNGATSSELEMRPGERLRLRIINTATARVMPLTLPDLAARLIALDGHPVTPRDMGTLMLGPAQRADVVVDIPVGDRPLEGLMLDPGTGDWVQIAGIRSTGEAVPATDVEVRPLPAWGSLPAPNLTDPQLETLVMEGGAMRGIEQATYRGKQLDIRELAAEGMVWAFNGVAHGMETPMFKATRGRTIRMEMVNRTAFPHAIHLHGHHFTVVTRDGAPDPYQDIRDTVLLAADETVEIAFVADNPGQWMLHCHMLSHQATGMMGWFEVA